MKAVVYCRISRDPTGTELGVRRQEADGRELCEREGYELIDVFVDDDRSAYSRKPRPGFIAMKELVAAGGVDVVVAWHPDRLTRHPRELEDLIDLLEASGTTVRTVQTGQYDLGTPAGRMAARIVGAVARHESEHKSARLRRKHLELAQAGKVSGGGNRPYGYTYDRLTVVEEEAEILREIARRLLAGETVRGLCADLNRRGLTTTSGREWYPGAMTRLLTRPRIAGLREHRGETTKAVWPAIIDPGDLYRLRIMLNDPSRKKYAGGRERKLLTGLLVCGQCGARLVSRPNDRQMAGYTCAKGPGFLGCGGLRIMGEPLDKMVSEAVVHRLSSPAMSVALEPPADDEPILEALKAVDARRDELAAMWAAGEIGRDEWAAAGVALSKRQAALEDELRAYNTASRRRATLTEGIADRWNSMTTEQQRAAIETIVDYIKIGPAVRGRNTFDDRRVRIEWKA